MTPEVKHKDFVRLPYFPPIT